MTPLLRFDDLTKKYLKNGRSDFIAVNHINFRIMPGEVLGIVGESGSGKSTIAKLAARLIDATEGSIFFKGEDITHAKGGKLRNIYSRIQMVFQTPAGSFDPRRTLGDGIEESLKNMGMSKAERAKRVKQLLLQCGLPVEIAARYPHEVSGGQCQRAAIARALACGPELIIFDEATSSLDVTVQKRIMELLRRLQKENELSYLFICHNLALVRQLCDRVIVLYEGIIAEEGTPDEVISAPVSEYAKKLVEAAKTPKIGHFSE